MATDEERRSALELLRGSRILAYSVGTLCLAAGAILLFWPDRTLVVVARIAGLLIAAVGIGETIETLTSHRGRPRWGLLLLRGLLNVACGALLLFWPGITVTVLVWLFGLDLVITGAIGLGASGSLPKEAGRSSLVLRSVVAIVFGLMIVAWPDVTLWVLAVLVALQLLLLGAILVYSGVQLSRVAHEI